MNIEKKKLNISRQSLGYAVLFAAALGFMLWKLPYGFGGSDEAFYLTVPYRLTLGDRLFSDEWHLSQLSSFLTLPFTALYLRIHGSTEGIMLAARYFYCVGHALVALVIYLRLKKYGALSAAASVLYMLFTPFDMMCYSYNTLALDSLALAGVLAGTARRDARGGYIAAGAFFACAVVCCPYLAVGYALYLAATALYSALWRKTASKAWSNPFFSWHAFGFFTCGIALVSALFAGFFFRHCSVAELISALPGLFTDPEHPSYSVVFMLKHYVYCLVTAHAYMLLPLGLYALSLVLLASDKKRRAHAPIHLLAACCCSLLCFALFSSRLAQEYYNGVMLPLVFVGLTAYLLLQNKPRPLFSALFVGGVVYSMCVCATSNMGFDVMSMAFSVVNIASCVFVGLLLKELSPLPGKKRVLARAAGLLPVVCLALGVVFSKATHCFWDSAPAQLHCELDRGPARGIVTSERLCADYTRVYDDISLYADRAPGKLLIYAQQTWCTLSMPEGFECASFSAWLSGLNETTEQRLSLYYELNGDKYPDYVYILKNNAFAQNALDAQRIYAAAQENGFTVEENSISWKLTKLGIA